MLVLVLVFALLLNGCGDPQNGDDGGETPKAGGAKDPATAKKENDAPPPIREKGTMDLYIDGVATQVKFRYSRFLDPGEGQADGLLLRGLDAMIHGRFDVNEDGQITAEDQLGRGWPLTPGVFLEKTLLLTSPSEEHENHFVLPDEGYFQIKEGAIQTQQFEMGNVMEGQAPTWEGTIQVVLVNDAGQEQEAYGRISGTLMEGPLRPRDKQHLDNLLQKREILKAKAEAEMAATEEKTTP